MVFWLYVGLSLAAPPLLYGLCLAVVYLYVRWKRPALLARLFKKDG